MARESMAQEPAFAGQLRRRDAKLVTSQNATFQQWQSLLTNRTKRLRLSEFLVQGVRPITQAVAQGWRIRALLHDGRPAPSSWAAELWNSVDTVRYLVSADLMKLLGEKSEGTPELLAIVEMPPDDFARIPLSAGLLVTVFDRPASPGNIGTLVRSVDAFGGSALIVTGHAADPYDPKCIRASTGSLFSVPVLRAGSHREVLAWAEEQRSDGLPVLIAGTDEHGAADIRELDFARPTVLVVGNETAGLTAGWQDSCDLLVRIPMVGSASSLNAATACSIVLYEAMRSREPGALRRSGGPAVRLSPE
jgi:23S rRNA (uridine2479-2'-O)-methyltransferase